MPSIVTKKQALEPLIKIAIIIVKYLIKSKILNLFSTTNSPQRITAIDNIKARSLLLYISPAGDPSVNKFDIPKLCCTIRNIEDIKAASVYEFLSIEKQLYRSVTDAMDKPSIIWNSKLTKVLITTGSKIPLTEKSRLGHKNNKKYIPAEYRLPRIFSEPDQSKSRNNTLNISDKDN